MKISPLFGILLSALATATMFMTGCGKTTTVSIADHPYISAHTAESVTINSDIIVEFSEETPFLTMPEVGSSADGILSLSPKVKGKATWSDSRTIVFTPSAPMKLEKNYLVTVKMGKLVEKDENIDEKYTFQFTTRSPFFDIATEGLEVYPDKEGIYKLSGTITTEESVDEAKVQKVLKMSGAGDMKASWTHSEDGKTHTFVVDSIKSKEESYDVVVKYDGAALGSNLTRQEVVMVPQKGVFSVIDLRVQYEPEFRAILTFSSEINPKQRFGDYMTYSPELSVRYVATGNKLFIYPTSRVAEDFRFKIEPGLVSNLGTKMDKTYEGTLEFKERQPTVRFINSGSILPSSNNMMIPFQSINYTKVQVKVTKIFQNNILQFFQVNNYNGEDELYRVGREIVKKEITLGKEDSPKLKQWGTYSLDLNEIIKAEQGAIYHVEIRGIDPLSDYTDEYGDWYYEYYGGPWETRHERMRNILASDVGVIAKAGRQGSISIYATNLISAQPISGAEVTIYDYTQQPLVKGSTDGNGFAEFNIKDDIPRIVVVRSGSQYGYLDISSGKSLSLSTFDVDGASVDKGLKCFIYGDRGVWRPGDNIFLSTMIMDRDHQLPKGHPITVDFTNPNGQRVSTQTKQIGKNGLNSFILKTEQDDITGYYQVDVTIGNMKTTKNLRIETVKPNRLKIDFSLEGEPIVSADNMKGKISSEWLHGASAGGLKTRVDMTISQANTTFDGYKDYIFNDKSKHFSSTEEKKVFEGVLDAKGVVQFTYATELDKDNIPAMLNAKYTVRVFEESGDFSIDQHFAKLSPYNRYVGFKVPETDNWRGRLDTGKENRFDVVLLTPQGKPVQAKNLQVEISKIEWFWWWNSSEGRTASYMKNNNKLSIFKTTTSTAANGRGSFMYKWNDFDWGLYIIEVSDPESGHSTADIIYVGSNYYNEGDDSGEAMLLNVKADKANYSVGETANITLESSQGARALVTVESGSKVLQSAWYDLKAASTTIPILITKEMTPNVYISVMMIQPHNQTLNDAPMRLYGIVPIMAEDKATRLIPVVSAPTDVKPEQEYTITVSEKNRQTMSYTIAVVDEGLLGLTRFKTPNPWDHFFAKEALGVSTWDIYNEVIGAYGGIIDQMFAIGGDDESEGDVGNQKAQRFKPVVKFMGPFELKKGETAKHKIKLDPYIGAVRTMVVACAENTAYGFAESKTTVKKPLMVQMTMPRVMGVDETVVVPVTLFSTEEGAQNVKVTLKNVEGFTVSGNDTQSIQLNGVEDKLVYFNLKASDLEAIGRVTIEASSSKDKTEETIEIDIRNPNPRSVNFMMESIGPGKSYSGNFALAGKKGTNSLALEASGVIPLNLSQRLRYLLNYPHGCLEQTTSTIFPQLFLARCMPNDVSLNNRASEHIKIALRKYVNFQLNNGSFSYWPGERYVNRWTSCYAGHFMVEAKKAGYAIPESLWSKWLDAESRIAREWSDNSTGSAGSIEVQAYRLYVLALAGHADMSAMNRLRENKNLGHIDRSLLAGAYGIAGRKDIGNDLIKDVSYTNWREDYDNGYSFGSGTRDRALVVVMNLHLGNRTQMLPLVQQLSKELNSNKWMSTQSTAWALMALSEFNAGSEGIELDFEYVAAGVKGKEKVKSVAKEINIDVKRQDGSVPVQVTNNSDKEIFITLTSYGVPSQGAEVERSDNIRIRATYTDLSGNTVDVTKLKQGDDFYVNLSVTNSGNMGDYENIVLSQVFPSGWEILESNASKGELRYQDIRDDRVYSYFDMNSSSEIVVRTKLSATYAGRFYLPSIVCEAMYDGRIYASTLGQWCEVTK